VAREARQFIARVDEQIARISSPEERLVVGFLMFVRALRGHDLVQRLLVTDPEQMLPLLTTDGNAALTLGREYILAQARQAEAGGVSLAAAPEYVAEILVRLAHSLVLTPQTLLPVEDETHLAELARALLVPLVFSHIPSPTRDA
jgi:TetR/AcrR family transcriptional regulator, repressor for uid operon